MHDVCMCGLGMWEWAGHSNESAAVRAVETQACRSEAHIVKHQCLTSKGAITTKRQLIQVIGLGKTTLKRPNTLRGISMANSDLLDFVFRELIQVMCLLASVVSLHRFLFRIHNILIIHQNPICLDSRAGMRGLVPL